MAQETWEIKVKLLDKDASSPTGFPTTGVTDELYCDTSTANSGTGYEGDLYYWTGSSYEFHPGPRPRPHVAS